MHFEIKKDTIIAYCHKSEVEHNNATINLFNKMAERSIEILESSDESIRYTMPLFSKNGEYDRFLTKLGKINESQFRVIDTIANCATFGYLALYGIEAFEMLQKIYQAVLVNEAMDHQPDLSKNKKKLVFNTKFEFRQTDSRRTIHAWYPLNPGQLIGVKGRKIKPVQDAIKESLRCDFRAITPVQNDKRS